MELLDHTVVLFLIFNTFNINLKTASRSYSYQPHFQMKRLRYRESKKTAYGQTLVNNGNKFDLISEVHYFNSFMILPFRKLQPSYFLPYHPILIFFRAPITIWCFSYLFISVYILFIYIFIYFYKLLCVSFFLKYTFSEAKVHFCFVYSRVSGIESSS